MAGQTRILLLGATGFIGGSILTELLQTQTQTGTQTAPSKYIITALVRQEAHLAPLRQAGVRAIPFQGLQDLATITQAASESDVVIAAASARDIECAQACIAGLAQRQSQRAAGSSGHYIHTSGASMVSDWPVTGERVDETTHSDEGRDVYAWERDHAEAYSAVRVCDRAVVEVGEKYGVRTYIVVPPLIYGRGTGFFNTVSGQVPWLAQLAVKHKQAVVIGDGKGIWSRIHVLALADLYSRLLQSITSSSETPSGRSGYYFAASSAGSWESIAKEIGKAGKAQGIWEKEEVKSISLKEAADVIFGGSLRHAESVLASNARIKSDRAKQVLGWEPKYIEEQFVEYIGDMVAVAGKTKEQV